jgi:hypothetical protein
METTLRIGSSGDRVRRLQAALAKAGYDVKPDGSFGPATDRVLRAYQRDHKLSADGAAGPKTLAALGVEYPTLLAIYRGLGKSLGPRLLAAEERGKAASTGMEVARSVSGRRMSARGMEFLYASETRQGVSCHLHWPGGESGVTLGAGYDMKEREAHAVKDDLIAIGVPTATAITASRGTKLKRNDAKQFASEQRGLITLSTDQQLRLLRRILPAYEAIVGRHVRVNMYDHQFDALVSFVYNPGASFVPVAREINKLEIQAAMAIILSRVPSSGDTRQGLTRRREKEVALFLFREYAK